jgi:anti-anti-sigma regulatory factor
MLRLTILSRDADVAILSVDGWLMADSVELLEQECIKLLATTRRLTLDLQGLRSIDREGVDLLRRLSARPVELRGGCAYVRVLLQAHGLRTESQTDEE